MINIVHPKVCCKPPIYKQNQPEVIKNRENNILKRKLSSNELQRNSNKESNGDTSKIANELKNSKTINDCNQNVIEPDSCSFEQLCSMISNLKQNSADRTISLEEKEQIKNEFHSSDIVQETYKNQVLPEKDYSQFTYINNGSTYEDIMSFLGTLNQEETIFDNAQNHNEYLTNETPAYLSNRRNVSSNCSREDTFKKIESSVLKDDLVTARLQLEEKEATMKFLKNELKNERKSACDKLEAQKKEHFINLQNQKNKYQGVIKRHQKFIEQIISEKKDLTEKCNSLTQHIKDMETKYQRELKVVAERHAIELQRAKELYAASEKIRRERWLEAKTTKIKEMTVKGLEPELRNMVEQHQREIQDLRSVHAKELQDVELRTIRRTNQQLEQLRLELTEYYDKILSEEKETMRKRYQQQLDEQETLVQIQKRKFFNDLQEEKHKFVQEQEKKDKERDTTIQKTFKEYYEKYDAMTRKFESDKKSFQESLLAERNAWMENNQRQYNTKLAIEEAQIADKCIRERDRQIELAIGRLEKETQNTKMNLQKSFDNKIKCLIEKYEADIQIATDKERLLKDKLDSTRKRLENTENELCSSESKFEHCNVELRESRKLIEKLITERDSAKKIARQEIESEKRELEKEISSLYEELTKNNSNNEALMAQIYSRIKLIVTQKDLAIKNLLKQVEQLKEKCEHLEKVVDQQRREYVLKSL